MRVFRLVTLTLTHIIMGVLLLSGDAYAATDNTVLPAQVSTEKPAIYVNKIEITGNNFIDENEIKAVLSVKDGDKFDKELILKELGSIYEMGYFTRNIKAQPIKVSTNQIKLRINVEENAPIKDFVVTGNTVLANGEIIEILEPLKGKPQNIKLINEKIQTINSLYNQKGYILSHVVSLVDDPDGIVNIEISEGRISQIKFEGNKKTKDFIIKRNILTKTGEVYNEEQIQDDISRLYATQAFKDIKRDIQPDENEPEKYVVTLQLTEQRSASISLGGGFDSYSGLFGQVGVTENNFRGRNQRISLNVLSGTGQISNSIDKLNRMNLQAELSFFEPSLRNTDVSLLSRIYARKYSSYQIPLSTELRYGASLNFDKPIKSCKNLTGRISLGGEKIKLKEGDFNQIQALYNNHNIPISKRAEQLQNGIFLSLSPGLIYDTRDNAANPRDGVIASLKLTGSLNVEDTGTSFTTASASIKRYFPLFEKSTISFMIKGGGKLAGDMPEVMAYRLGGGDTIRGFNLSNVGTGEGFVMASAEYRTPIPFLDRLVKNEFVNSTRLAFFVDAGTLYNRTISDVLYDKPGKAISTGVGLRISVPGMGPIGIDYGIPLTARGPLQKRGCFTFGIGDYWY